ncbi:phosphate ABC transporter ATP-binding protein [Halodesulfovibrio sp.]|jgi:phosphate transport system ATP-binding protein|uniref:phosphate ABC transporter ATP-binding protein n=1 Tax=Halodesulfovibrio sp. TaxID=1912772 RepID=UPI0025EE31E9|nr:phosphate ABC transporter ATP-binding protein [Halodesulfovibrio sp.]MCT4627226.1 phosphate ABC transporter ATP-binding protein [Halodesulfovibrio sp.]
MSSIISFNNVTVSFQGNPSVSDISFDVKPDELTVLVGRSGSGKSTLLRAVNKLNDCFDGCTTQGSIVVRIGGEAVEITSPKTDPNFLRSRVGMVFQTPNVLPVSIERNLLLPQKLVRGTSDYNARKNMERVLDEVGLLEEVKDRLPAAATTLSGGQQQRLCLARALALEPEILLLDEPTASVDHKSSKLIEELLLRLAPTLPMLVVSHSLAQTRSLADRVFLVRQGGIAGSWNRKHDSDAALDNLLYTTF